MAFRYHKFGIIISIDFGTTFSGTCYAVTSQLSNTELRDKKYPDFTVVSSWPEQADVENKTPSINIYDRNFHLLYWGKVARKYIENGELKPGQIVKERFKLGLPSFIPQKGAIYKTNNAKKTEHDNMRATIDYFREIFDHTVSTIQKNIAVGPVTVEKDNIRFVITVPAQWNDVQRAIMRTVAKEAGLITDGDHENRLLVINESSAATLHCEQKKTDLEDMKPGDKYIICDAGGGTVNLATFESVKTVDGDPADGFRHCQLTTDSSEKCGSTFVDKKMRELLTRVCYNGVKAKDKEEEKARDKLFSPVIDRFTREIKPVFGRRSRDFKFPKCKHEKLLKVQPDFVFRGPIEGHIDDGNLNDKQCIVCKAEDFKHMHKSNFGEDTIVVLRDANIVPKLKFYLPDNVGCEVNGGVCTLTIPYDIMRLAVFEEVTKCTLKLIDGQIKKANNNIRRTYLVGGFGSSPYLQKRILKAFWKKNSPPLHSEYRIGTLITDMLGISATMRGAMMYGIDCSRRKPQTDVVKEKFGYTSTEQYNTLICLDIGYLSTSCSYRDLGNESDEMIEITNWPGLQEESFMIPTAKETVNGKTTWGAQVKQPINPDKKEYIAPSKLMPSAKANLRHYFCEYLDLVLGHVHKSIMEANPQLSDKDKYRYVITMENCYEFVSKSEMRYIAQLADIISKEDPVERLLLIGRDTAAALYTEKEYFSHTPAYTNHVLMINMYHDICSLSLMEHTKISGTDIDSTDEQDTGVFRNIRSVRSATFDFDFTSRITFYLDKYVSENTCIQCKKNHKVYNSTYYSELKRGFLSFIKTRLDFCSHTEIQNIPITDSGCCIASIKVYNLLEYIFLPTVKELASEVYRFVSQTGMIPNFSFDKVLLSGIFLETKKSNYEFLEDNFINNISKIMSINTNYISPSNHNGKEALLGAALYGNRPEIFTERVARTSYAINVCAFRTKNLPPNAKNRIKEEGERNKDEDDLKKKLYDIESANVFASDERVDLFYQSIHKPSLYTSTFNGDDGDLYYFIRRGDKILEKHQSEGIFRTFYAQESCIVYATIYYSEVDVLPTEGIKADSPKFRKLHQFELYLKHDEANPMSAGKNPRLLFNICLTFDNNEAKFGVNIDSEFRNKSPGYRFRDEFLVANIYDDRQLIEISNLAIDDANKV